MTAVDGRPSRNGSGWWTSPASRCSSCDDIRVKLSGLQILDGVSIAVPPGKVTGLIGPNGAGKTTVFNVISGFVKPDSGEVRYRGRRSSASGRTSSRRWASPGPSRGSACFASLTALENVMLGGSSQRAQRADLQSLAMPWTDIETERAAGAVPGGDGGAGHRRRGGPAARASCPTRCRRGWPWRVRWCPTRELLLLDEPAGGVGAADMAELERLIRSWVPERTVLLVEHHMELVMAVCDLIWVLDAGKVIASGTPDEVRNDPAVLAAYLGQEGAA